MNLNLINDQLINVIRNSNPSQSDIEHFLDMGADVNYQIAENGYSPLMIAVEDGKDFIAQFLLWSRANPLLVNNKNMIASDLLSSDSLLYQQIKDFELLYATLNNDFTLVKSIVNAGALINFQGHGGYTALMIAIEENHIELVEYFLDQGADMALKCDDGRGVFELVTNQTIQSFLLKMKKLRNEILNTPEKITFRFFTNTKM